MTAAGKDKNKKRANVHFDEEIIRTNVRFFECI